MSPAVVRTKDEAKAKGRPCHHHAVPMAEKATSVVISCFVINSPAVEKWEDREIMTHNIDRQEVKKWVLAVYPGRVSF